MFDLLKQVENSVAKELKITEDVVKKLKKELVQLKDN